jgi:proline iminopeptidase
MKSFEQIQNPSFVDRMLAFGPKLWYTFDFDAKFLWQGVNVNRKGVEIIWGHMFENYPTPQTLNLIQCPIFIALGRHDYFNPPYLWDQYKKDLGRTISLEIFEKSSHTPQLEDFFFDSALIRWLKI